MFMPSCAKYSLHRYACRDFCRPPSNTVRSIFSPNSMICVETLTNITILQEVSWLCQSVFAGEKPCDWLFLSLLMTSVSTANKDRYFRILALSPFSRKRLVGGFFGCFLTYHVAQKQFCIQEEVRFLQYEHVLKPWVLVFTFYVLASFQREFKLEESGWRYYLNTIENIGISSLHMFLPISPFLIALPP